MTMVNFSLFFNTIFIIITTGEGRRRGGPAIKSNRGKIDICATISSACSYETHK
jgi:hypothetical protein